MATADTAEKIKIDKLWEFQIYEIGNFGDPKPVGGIVRDLDPYGNYDDGSVTFERDKRYALKRREITLDDDGYPTYGEWDWASEWVEAIFPKEKLSIRVRWPRWITRLVDNLSGRS